MQIVEFQDNIFENIEMGDSIAHGANCYGVMGAGVAKGIKALSAKNFHKYRMACQKGTFIPGDCLSTVIEDDRTMIFNLATQFATGPNAEPHAIDTSVRRMVRSLAELKRPVVKTVRLGCGIGGLNWDDVKPILEAINTDIVMEVYYT